MENDNHCSSRGSVYARAQHAFFGKNNDELSFGIGDVIAITQQIDGGWWEGTLNGETGWFPSGYVSIIHDKENVASVTLAEDTTDYAEVGACAGISTQKQFISEVLKTFLNSESEYVQTLKLIVENYLAPLHASNVVNESEFETIEGNVSSIYALQATLYKQIKDMHNSDLYQQRIGGSLISSAPELKELLIAYCSNHPHAVEMITHKRDELDTFFSSRGGEMRKFILGLSEPFRHLSTYPVMLQELHRNMPESHADRGDIQRSVAVYRDLKEMCEWVRRQEEMQMEFIRTPRVNVFVRERQPGKLIMLGGASVGREGEETVEEERTLALFTDCLVLCEMTSDGEDYELHELIPIPTLRIRRIQGKNAIVTNRVPDEITLSFPSSYDIDRWMDALKKCRVPIVEEINGKDASPSSSSLPPPRLPSIPVPSLPPPAPIEVMMRNKSLDQMQAALREDSNELALLRKKKTNHGSSSTVSGEEGRGGRSNLDDSLPFRFNHELEMIMPDGNEEEEDYGRINTGSAFYMRHYPPYRSPRNVVDLSKRTVKMRKDPNSSRDHGDATLLAIVEGYLGVGAEEKERGGVGQAPRPDQPQLIVAEEEKLLIEETVDGQTVMTEKSLVDVVYALKDQMDQMSKEMASLRSMLEKEQKARRRMEESMKRNSLQLSTSTPKPLLDTSG